MGKTRGVDFDTPSDNSSTDGGEAVNDEPKAILLLHEDDTEHTGGSKGEGSDPNLRRLTDKSSIRPLTLQQPRVVVASRFPCNFLNFSGYSPGGNRIRD